MKLANTLLATAFMLIAAMMYLGATGNGNAEARNQLKIATAN